MSAVVEVARELLELLAPSRCAGCGEVRRGEGPFCGACEALLEPMRRGLGLYAHGGPLARAIARLKYGPEPWLARPLGELLAVGAVRRHGGQVDAVVPVPLHPRRLRARGFDQAALLARPVARALGVPLRLDLLRRHRNTPPQVGLGAAERLANVRGAFSLRRSARGVPTRPLLLDDVTTTGATLQAAALPLREAGSERVLRLALAQRAPG